MAYDSERSTHINSFLPFPSRILRIVGGPWVLVVGTLGSDAPMAFLRRNSYDNDARLWIAVRKVGRRPYNWSDGHSGEGDLCVPSRDTGTFVMGITSKDQLFQSMRAHQHQLHSLEGAWLTGKMDGKKGNRRKAL
jgi:hypothetical protein